jgi:hypothetical protein
VESVFTQCAKALIRSRLWAGADRAAGLPTLGALVAEHTAGRHGGEALDARLPESYRTTLY